MRRQSIPTPSGLDYPGTGPEHALLKDEGRIVYDTVSDEDAVEAFFKLSRYEALSLRLKARTPSLLPCAMRVSTARARSLPTFPAAATKDIDYVIEHYGNGENYL